MFVEKFGIPRNAEYWVERLSTVDLLEQNISLNRSCLVDRQEITSMGQYGASY